MDELVGSVILFERGELENAAVRRDGSEGEETIWLGKLGGMKVLGGGM
jgi:hypothetical protein